MKRQYPLMLLLCLFTVLVFAEPPLRAAGTPELRSPLLFEEFMFGTVVFKSGTKKGATFNYNTVTEQMVFLREGKVWALETPGVDTIYIAGRKFVPLGKVYSEILKTSAGLLYVRHQAEMLDKGNAIGYGGYSQTSNSGTLNNTAITGTFKALEALPRFELETRNGYWLRTAGNFFEVHSPKHLQKAFPAHKKKIEQLVRQLKTDFAKPEAVVVLLQHLQTAGLVQ
jgi:hypothetical protein